MRGLLKISAGIDWLNETVGRIVIWLCLIVVLISSTNAVVRKLFSVSSNAWLELQWYLFGAIFLLASGYTLLRNEHVRVDILSARMSRRNQLLVEIFGVLFFLLPIAVLILILSWPVFIDSFIENEQSSNAGGLVRWPMKLLVPIGFLLLVLAGISHLIKCIGCLLGMCPDPTLKEANKSSEQALAEEIAMYADNQSIQHNPVEPIERSAKERNHHG
ncbi:TRAP transporter small permease subunit [Orrella daihaiensis]|uniref:TRAP transporter small permease protein n=1 Tax=Orrella daihaiensis TaxID=2782176 RepID=A0ABY4AIX5_9BURK|nr:TRAP transporter small permease subunit [Orrella daihaiensis]UOD50124.1 TRAP transporter small permease subunit [Orrella daihaiensis]